MNAKKGWKSAKLKDIPPLKQGWTAGWHSVRHHLDVEAFGINAITAQEDDQVIIKEHDETRSNQQEVFFVHSGKCEFVIDGESFEVEAGAFVAVDPLCKRSVKALSAKTELIIIGAPIGEPYKKPKWDTL